MRPQRRDQVGQPVLERAAGGERDRPSRQRQPAMCRISIHIVIISVRYMRNRIYGLALLTARVVDPARGVALSAVARRDAEAEVALPPCYRGVTLAFLALNQTWTREGTRDDEGRAGGRRSPLRAEDR